MKLTAEDLFELLSTNEACRRAAAETLARLIADDREDERLACETATVDNWE